MLVILSRHNRAMYWLLQRQISGPGIEVIIDRRERERRTASRVGTTVERRRGDRRINQLDDRLREFGWVVVGGDVARAQESCTVCGQVILPDEGRYRPPAGASHAACHETGNPVK